MLKRSLFVIALLLAKTGLMFSQSARNVSFFKVSPSDFNIDLSKVDTSEGAVYIADIGNSSFEGNTQGLFVEVYKRKMRIKIINKKGFDAASFKIRLYHNKSNTQEDRIEDLKAVAYNVENGKVIETPLEKEAVFTEKVSATTTSKNFTMAGVKEGSIIDISYTVISDFIQNLTPWYFQGTYPKLWSEYEVNIPEFFIYTSLEKGYVPFVLDTSMVKSTSYQIRDATNVGQRDNVVNVRSENLIHRWGAENVPSMKLEKFTSDLGNFISAVEFQLSGTKFNNNYRDILGTWSKVSEELLKMESFGFGITQSNSFMDEDLKPLLAGVNDRITELQKIYAFVRDHFQAKSNGGIYLSQPIKDIYKNKSGTHVDVNMVLIAMLAHQHFDVQPVILSTRNNGYTQAMYPLLNQYNYVVARVMVDNEVFFLDASVPVNPFNKLPTYCYNGHARIIDQQPRPVFFVADSLKDTHFTTITLVNDEKKPNTISGNLTTKFGFYESYGVRMHILEKGQNSFFKEINDDYSGDYAAGNIGLDNLNAFEKNVELSHDISVNLGDNNQLIYFSPMLKEGLRENDFKSAKRLYPVEMDSRKDDIYLFQMEIPKGYVVEELPKSAKVLLNEADGYFEYIVESTPTDINIRSRIKLNKATFPPEDYDTLRNFYDLIVKKHAEQIVFKKQGS